MGQNKLTIIVLILLLVAAASFSCKSKDDEVAQVQVVTVERGALTIDVTASGNLTLSQTADLAFEVAGYVYRVLVEEGDPVKEGDLLAEVDPFDWEEQKGTLERSVVQATVNLNTAQMNLEKAKSPTTTTSTISGAITAPDPLDIETKELQVQMAKMSLNDAQRELDRFLETSSQVLAPFDGFVTHVNVQGGDEVWAGTIAVSVADPAKFEADILVNEMDIDKIAIEMPATVELMASSSSRFLAEVTKIAPTATNQSGVINYQVKVELLSALRPQQGSQRPEGMQPPQATGGSTQSAAESIPLQMEDLRDGLTVTISIVIEEKTDVLLVPNRAIIQQGAQTVVQVSNGETPEFLPVRTGISDFQYTEIIEGLSEGQQIIVPMTTTVSTQTQSGGTPALRFPPGGGMR
jgi:RND family efflux transporter MFP subunit